MSGCYKSEERTGTVAREPMLLDTSALIALMEDEAGAQQVEQAIRQKKTLLPWLVLLEVHYITQQERGRAEADRRFAIAKELPSTILWEIDEPMVLTASRLKAGFHLSLADSLIAAYAIREGATLMHKDPEFEALADQVPLEGLPYKRQSAAG